MDNSWSTEDEFEPTANLRIINPAELGTPNPSNMNVPRPQNVSEPEDGTNNFGLSPRSARSVAHASQTYHHYTQYLARTPFANMRPRDYQRLVMRSVSRRQPPRNPSRGPETRAAEFRMRIRSIAGRPAALRSYSGAMAQQRHDNGNQHHEATIMNAQRPQMEHHPRVQITTTRPHIEYLPNVHVNQYAAPSNDNGHNMGYYVGYLPPDDHDQPPHPPPMEDRPPSPPSPPPEPPQDQDERDQQRREQQQLDEEEEAEGERDISNEEVPGNNQTLNESNENQQMNQSQSMEESSAVFIEQINDNEEEVEDDESQHSQENAETAVSAAVKAQDLNKSLLSLLECPVCMDNMEPPICQCRRGHLLCHRCRGRLTMCPVCRSPLSSVRNRAMEKVAEIIQYPCRHGCGHETHLKTRRPHEDSCEQRLYPCPFKDCGHFHMLYFALKDHFQTQHELKIGPKHKLMIKMNKELNAVWAISAHSQLFHARVELQLRAWCLIVYVAFVGPARFADRYSYRVSLQGRTRRRLAYCRPTHSDVENYNFNVSRKDCFHLCLDDATNFLRGRSGRYNIHEQLTFCVAITDDRAPRDPLAIHPERDG